MVRRKVSIDVEETSLGDHMSLPWMLPPASAPSAAAVVVVLPLDILDAAKMMDVRSTVQGE